MKKWVSLKLTIKISTVCNIIRNVRRVGHVDERDA